ncbi:hypothetical protein RBH29_02610 [Herbivorax sp. ANBcel31]|uniref:hypothetical protein n=1 Tax=Herbivorax sp. ANBcel31 TaxID=3069754 RepID=UPI0027B2810E|nr:hypothetical protein [Herbivorax sp. ANBcel31]MDQ2085329.1 hypothetical protein [Herbivorax sp. ANBcel31]
MRKLPILMTQEEHWQYMKEKGKFMLFFIKPFYVSLAVVVGVIVINFLFDLAAYGYDTTIANLTGKLPRMLLLWIVIFLIWAMANVTFWVYYSIKLKK